MKDKIITAIDVGTTKICTLVGRQDLKGEVEVLGTSMCPSSGLHKGIVVDIPEAAYSIRNSIAEAEKASSTKITSAFVGVTGTHIICTNVLNRVTLDSDHPIAPKDVDRALLLARRASTPPTSKVLHAIPRSYSIDGQKGIKSPLGMHGIKLEVETHLILGASNCIEHLVKSVEKAGIRVSGLVLEPIASSEAVLSPEEREMGVVVADIGGGTTDVALFDQGSVYHTAVIPVAGYQFTNDLAVAFNCPYAEAERLKVAYGTVDVAGLKEQEDQEVEVASFGGAGRTKVPLRVIAQAMRDRAEELLTLLAGKLQSIEHKPRTSAGLVLTGGSSKLRALDLLAREKLDMPVRIGMPRYVHGLIETLQDPAYATSVGTLIWGIKQKPGLATAPNGYHGFNPTRFYQRVVSWLRGQVPAQNY